jgi:hypothetical protein
MGFQGWNGLPVFVKAPDLSKKEIRVSCPLFVVVKSVKFRSVRIITI